MLAQMMQVMMQTQQQQQQRFQQQLQFNTFMAHQAEFQRQVLTAQTQARMPHKKKGDPPTFNGKASEDLELWIFSTEQYYAQYREGMNRDSSDFVDTIFANLGPCAQTWFRDFKLSLGQEQPVTWSLFKTKIRERFRDSNFQQKVMPKLYELRWQGSQQGYTTRFLHLLSQLDEESPEFVKRWLYQQNLRQETSRFVSQNVPETLQDAIELAQRFEDSRPGSSGRRMDTPKPAAKTTTASAHKTEGSTNQPRSGKVRCSHCKLSSHSTDVCRRKKAAEAAAAGTTEQPKNGAAR
jgi:hypothetical protein